MVLPPLVVLLVAGLLSILVLHNDNAASSIVYTAPSAPEVSAIFTAEVQYWGTSIASWASAADLDPDLAAVVMQIESCGDPRALSSAGAMGLFQVMPYHFAAAEEPYSPEINAARGLDYLRRALSAADGNARLALAGYNGGIGIIGLPESTWPAETIQYAYWGTGIYADARGGFADSPRLTEWLKAGGTSLCLEARQRLRIEG